MAEVFLVEDHGERERDSSERKGVGRQLREGARRKCETVKVRAVDLLRGRRVFPSLFLKYIASKITNLPIKLLSNYS